MKFLVEAHIGIGEERYRLQNDGGWRLLNGKSLSNGDYAVTEFSHAALALPRDKSIELGGKKYIANPTMSSVGDLITKTAFVNPYVHRIHKPRLFTPEELETVIARGDDRKYNALVLDLQGYFRLLPRLEVTALTPLAVRHETFCPGNDYVGGQAAADDDFINRMYRCTLESWVEHLQTGAVDIFNDELVGKKSEEELWEEVEELTRHLL